MKSLPLQVRNFGLVTLLIITPFSSGKSYPVSFAIILNQKPNEFLIELIAFSVVTFINRRKVSAIHGCLPKRSEKQVKQNKEFQLTVFTPLLREDLQSFIHFKTRILKAAHMLLV